MTTRLGRGTWSSADQRTDRTSVELLEFAAALRKLDTSLAANMSDVLTILQTLRHKTILSRSRRIFCRTVPNGL